MSDVQNVFSNLTGVSCGNAARTGIRNRCSIVQCGAHKRIATPRKTSHLANSEMWEGSGRNRGHLTQHIRSARVWWEKLKADAACSEAVSARAPSWSWTVQIHTGLSLLHPIFMSPDFNSSHPVCFLSFRAGGSRRLLHRWSTPPAFQSSWMDCPWPPDSSSSSSSPITVFKI